MADIKDLEKFKKKKKEKQICNECSGCGKISSDMEKRFKLNEKILNRLRFKTIPRGNVAKIALIIYNFFRQKTPFSKQELELSVFGEINQNLYGNMIPDINAFSREIEIEIINGLNRGLITRGDAAHILRMIKSWHEFDPTENQ